MMSVRLSMTFAFRQVQTSRRRLAMTHRHGRDINAHPSVQIYKEKADDSPSPLGAWGRDSRLFNSPEAGKIVVSQ
jgi:hypothetical protein